MRRMAVRAAGHLFRVAQAVVLAVITFHISFCRHVKDIIALHHFFVAVAFHADLGVKFTIGMRFGVPQGLDVVEIVAIVAGGGILVARCNRSAVNGFPVDRLMIMTLDAFGNDNAFILFPILVRMDIRMAVRTHDVLLYVHACVMFGVFLLMTAFAMHLLDFNLALHVFGKIRQLHMAAVAAVFSVNGIGKGGLGNFIAVAAQ